MANRRMSDPPKPSRPMSAAAVPQASPVAAAAAVKPKKRRPTAKTQAVIATTTILGVSEDERRGMIALSAYLRGERRGFAPGGEAEDWLAAEKEIDALLSGGHDAAQ
jgi:Protein of unknown function (DUF2934)